MSQESVERIIGRAVTDADFRQRLIDNAAEACKDYDLTPDEYRAKWGLPSDYPMVAPNYAKARSALAREMGLGQKRAAR